MSEKNPRNTTESKIHQSCRPQFAKELWHHHACNIQTRYCEVQPEQSFMDSSINSQGLFLIFSNFYASPQYPCKEKSMLRKCRNSPAFCSNPLCHHRSLCTFLQAGGNKSNHPIANIPKGSYQQTLPRIRSDEDVR